MAVAKRPLMLYSNFKHTIHYIPLSERDEVNPTVFLLQPLSYKTFTSLYSLDSLPDGCYNQEYHNKLLQECIVSAQGLPAEFYTHGHLKPVIWSSVLPLDLQQELISLIDTLYLPNKDFYDSLALSLELTLNDKYKGESWDCTSCQARNLHKQRNCYLISKDEHEDSISYQVLDEIHTECPMNKKDVKLLDAAFHARNYSESGFLPEVGALGDQTVFFVIASQKTSAAIIRQQNKRAEESATKRN